ncbi:iron chelate uptake ABC transporter family permease subunit, partial [Bacillus velezensis]|uniref:iron chelate uptake ABC transporter family permease subunit n=1 Tax=Bacillus velezensis TaxID=492670 RepID=UPI00201BCD7F
AFVLLILLANPELTHLIPLEAFVGGLIAAAIVYVFAWRRTGITPITIILSGVAVNALCGGVI